ncbi:hypothetical protein I3842_Q095300 [Carya illinoinensis]|uniref:Uncharacterized protein n=1 Tax=Carya illinoinensis TaxID=32201 RepID=A0A922A0T6_CARIL|nr:hypothetical protein I3842_Q095300 [Carya illinoinensis]
MIFTEKNFSLLTHSLPLFFLFCTLYCTLLSAPLSSPIYRRADHYVAAICCMILGEVGSTPIDQDCYVFKVHHHLREINAKAYEPDLLAIGPYHHGKDHLSFMEMHKLRFLRRMLKRRGENGAERYITAMIGKVERARRFYADEFPELSKDEFGLRLDTISQSVENEPIFQTDWMINGIMHDLLLFENQLSFFILTELFEMSEGHNQQYPDNAHHESVSTQHLLDCALAFFSLSLEISFVLDVNGSNYVSTTKHLLGLVHEAINPSSKEQRPQKRSAEPKETKKLKNLAHPNENEDWNSIPYATYFRMSGLVFMRQRYLGMFYLPIPNVIELQEAGVKFNKGKIDNLFHIKFNNGVMEIPPLNIVDNTESVFRNLIAYDQHSQHIDLNYFTDFATLMDYLINTPKDVELLRQKGIINSWMGDDEVVSNMFNKFCSYTHFSKDFYYADIIKEVNKHCDKRWNVRKAKLRHDYFNSPWALLSVLAAILLLLLAIAQTLFSILSYVVK